MIKHIQLLFIFLPIVCLAQPKTNLAVFNGKGNYPIVQGLFREPVSGNIQLVHYFISTSIAPFKGKYNWTVDTYSPELKQLASTEPLVLEFPNGKDAQWGFVSDLGRRPSMLFYQIDKKEDKIDVYRSAIGSNGAFSPLKKLGELAGKQRQTTQLLTSYSADSSMLLLLFHPRAIDKNYGPFSYLVFDTQWNLIRQGNLRMPEEQGRYLLGRPMLNMDTSIWLPAWKHKDNDDLLQEAWVWKNGQAVPQRIDVSLSSERLITDMVFRQSPISKLVYAGGSFTAASSKAKYSIFSFSSYLFDRHPTQGTFCTTIDTKAQKVLVKWSNLFKPKTLEQVDIRPEDFSKGKGIPLLGVADIHLLSNGSIWVNLEQYVYYSKNIVCGPGPFIIGAEADYGHPDFGPFLSVEYDPTGAISKEVHHGRSIGLPQDKGQSHFFAAGQQGAYILYNDHNENINDQGPKTWLKYRTSRMSRNSFCTALWHVPVEGEGQPVNIFNLKESGVWIEPLKYIEYTPGNYILACGGFQKYGIFRIDTSL